MRCKSRGVKCMPYIPKPLRRSSKQEEEEEVNIPLVTSELLMLMLVQKHWEVKVVESVFD